MFIKIVNLSTVHCKSSFYNDSGDFSTREFIDAFNKIHPAFIIRHINNSHFSNNIQRRYELVSSLNVVGKMTVIDVADYESGVYFVEGINEFAGRKVSRVVIK